MVDFIELSINLEECPEPFFIPLEVELERPFSLKQVKSVAFEHSFYPHRQLVLECYEFYFTIIDRLGLELALFVEILG